MNEQKIQIESPEQFQAAMQAVQSSSMLLSSFDWAALMEKIQFFEGPGAVLDPGIFIEMNKDPQWEVKKQLFIAANRFVKELEDIREQLADAE